MTNANFKDEPIPRFDRELVHAHIRLLHDLAARARADLAIDGQLVLACYGENPDTGVKTASQVMKFGIGDGLEEMVDVIMALEHHPHLNVYVPFHIVRFGLGPRERGGLRISWRCLLLWWIKMQTRRKLVSCRFCLTT
jgi:hypothetical protein